MNCPKCGALINEGNHLRCSRFPVCCFQMKAKESILDPFQGTYIIYDLETTGLDRKKSRIIEIGAVKVENGRVVDHFDLLANPGFNENGIKISIPLNISRITGITNNMVESCVSEKEALQQFTEWCGNITTCVGHNIAKFDIPLMKSACKRNDVRFPFEKKVDTLEFAEKLALKKNGLIENNKQPTLAKYLGFDYQAHRADEDTNALYRVLTGLVKKEGKMPLISAI